MASRYKDSAISPRLTSARERASTPSAHGLPAACVAALKDQAYFRDCCGRIRETREWFSKELRSIGYEVIPSQGNFVFAAPPDRDGRRVYDGLYSRKILVRHFTDPLLSHGLRITIGARTEMETTLAALKKIG